MKRFALALCLLLGVSAFAAGGTYTVGTVFDDYVFANDGYWHKNGQVYTHAAVWHEGCGYGCNARPGYYTHSFSLYTPAAAPYTPPALKIPTYTDPGWRVKLLDLAAQRDKAEAKFRADAAEHQQYIDALNQLGFAAPRQSYAQLSPGVYAGGYEFRGQTVTSYGVQGNTQYGYNDVAKLYGDNNQAQLFQQYAQLVQQSQALGGQANAGFLAALTKSGDNQARVQEALTRGYIAKQIIDALNTGPSSVTQSFTFRTTPSGVLQPVATDAGPDVKLKLAADLKAVVDSSCVQCHSGEAPKGKLDMTQFATFTAEQKEKIIRRLTTDDDKLLMPRLPDGGPGVRLSPEKLRPFLLN